MNCIAPGPFPSEIIDFNSPAIVKIIENVPVKRAGKDTVKHHFVADWVDDRTLLEWRYC